MAVVAIAIIGLTAPDSARAQGIAPSTTTAPTASGATTVPKASSGAAVPSGAVAYVTADGGVWAGEGASEPVRIADNAALGRAGQAAVKVAPTADVLAYVRNDGAVVIVPFKGGEPTVVATDAATSSLGKWPSLSWNFTGDSLAYIAVGTPDMVPPPSPTAAPGIGSFRTPIADAPLGTVIKVVDREGKPLQRIGDPSTRSIVGMVWSPSEDIILVASNVPGSNQPFTVAAASSGSGLLSPTPFAGDELAFAPDGRFILAVGPAKGKRELIRISTDTLDRTMLTNDDKICNPVVSPDGTRIAYAYGQNCSRLKLISSKGGTPIDITPGGTQDTASFGIGALGWTEEGRFITHPSCENEAGTIRCDGPTMFFDPDTGKRVDGPDATTITPITPPLVQDVYVDIDFRGPLQFRHSFLIDPTVTGQLTDTGANGGKLTARLVDGGTQFEVNLTMSPSGGAFVTGTFRIIDPNGGIDRTFLVLGHAFLVAVRVFSISGMWVSSNDLPFATGEFNVAIRRR
ncbi:MAG: TolB family protein [Acidimicrobiales bacterium]